MGPPGRSPHPTTNAAARAREAGTPILAVLIAVVAITAVHARNTTPDVAWPQFRGPAGAGILDQAKLPATWSKTSNVAWSAEVKGRGWSSPVAWDDQVFVTSAISPGAFKAPSTGIFGNDYVAQLSKQGLSDDEVTKQVIARDIELTNESGEIRYMVYAFDAKTGRLLGAHMVGAEVTELIQGFVIAMGLETTEEDLMHTVFPHPTLSEMMHESVLDSQGRVIHM